MKKTNLFKLTNLQSVLCVSLRSLLVMSFMSSFVWLGATSMEYAAAEADSLVSHIEQGLYDEYVLSESGGIYDLKDIDVATDAIVKAKDGLDAKPTVIYTGKNTSAYTAFFDLGATDLTLTFQGILFDGATDSVPMMGVTRIDMANCDITMIDCEVQNFTTSSGFVRIDKAGAVFTIEDSYVHDCYGRLIRVGNNGDAFGDITIDNCTFANITDDPVIQWVSAASSTVPNITINQSTFYNIADNAFKFGTVNNGVSITNCNFDVIAKAIENAMSSTVTLDYCYGGFGEDLVGTVTVTNTVDSLPQYQDASNLDLTLLNSSDLLGSDGATPIGDSRWVPLVLAPNEYAADDVDSLVSHMEQGLYAEYILCESGGVYDFKDIDIATDAIVKAKDGLEEMPTIIFTGDNTSAYNAFFDLAATDLSITLQGIIFDGTAAPNAMMGVTRIDMADCDITMIDCEVKNFSTSSGFVRIDKAGAVFTIEDSYVHDCYGRLIRVGNNGDAYGDITIDNCTFANITDDPVIQWVSAASSTVPNITINQSTFYNIADNAFKFGTVNNGVSITNCNFDAISKGIENAMSSAVTLDYCYGGFTDTLVSTVVVSNEVSTAPQYSNAAQLDLKLLNENELMGSDGVTPIGDSRWTSAAGMDLLEVLYSEQVLTDEAGQEALLKSSVSYGYVYIILDGEAQATVAEMEAAVASNKGVKDTVVAAYENVALSVAGITNGIYYGYVVDLAGNISAKGSNTITVYAALNVQNEEQSIPNSTGNTVEVTSSKDGFVYVAMEGDYPSVDALNAAVNGGRAAKTAAIAETPANIDISGVRAGTYYAYAVDAAGNLSERGVNPIYITTSVYVDYKTQTASNKAGHWAYAYVSAGTSNGVAYLLNDAISADAAVTLDMLNAAIETMDADSMTIPIEMMDYKVPTVGLNPGSYHFYLVKDGMVSEQGPASITVRKPVTYYFSADEVEDMRMALYTKEITTGDEVVLTTSGGHYGFKTYFRIYGGITFRAAEGLAEKPVFCYDPDAHGETHRSYMRLMEFYPPAGMVYIKGIEFDGGAADESINNDATCIFEARYNATFDYPYAVVYEDCYIHDFNTLNTSSSGATSQDGYVFRQRANAYADSIIFNNCVIRDTYKAALNFINGSDYAYFGKLDMTNTTIKGVNGMISISSADMTASTINIDQCTMDSIAEDDADARLVLSDGLEGLSISNSIISNSCSSVAGDTALILGAGSSVSNSAFYNTGIAVDGTVTSVSTDKNPMYYASPLFNYAVMNAELLTASTSGGQIGDLRWLATSDFEVEKEMLTDGTTALILYFNQPFDTISAKVATNYTLSGSYGATGNPTGVEILAANAVKLILNDFSDGEDFETIVVNAANVTNVNANAIVSGSEVATYIFPILANMPAQTVGNEDGQYVLATCGSTNGYVYLVPAAETENIVMPEHLEALIDSGFAAKAMVTTAGEFAQIPVGDLVPGTYYAYAVNDAGDKMSVKSAEMANVLGLESTMGLQFNITNADDQVVVAQSSYADAQLYLAVDDTAILSIESKQDLLDAVTNNYAAVADVLMPFQDVEISVAGIYATEAGVRYRAYAVSGDSISEASTGAVIIADAPSALNEISRDDLHIFAYQGLLTVKLKETLEAQLKVYNLNGQLVKTLKVYDDTHFDLERGVYIIQVKTENGISSRKLVN